MLTSTRSLLLSIAAACFALLGFALYLQFYQAMAPCPLCIMQRYAFVAVALICLVSAFLPAVARKIGTGLAFLAAATGFGLACWHLWIKAHPGTSCGIDPMETALNKVFTAKMLPFLFQADGFCTTEYDPILGLSIPQWSLVWFALFTLLLGGLSLRRAR